MMAASYPLGYPIVNPGMNYWSYDLFTYPLDHPVDLPLTFYIEIATKLDPSDDATCARTSTSIGALLLQLFKVKMPYSYWALILTDLLYALYTKRRLEKTDSLTSLTSQVPNSKPGTADASLTYDSDADFDLDSDSELIDKSDIFPSGLDFYLAVSSVFEENYPRGSTWFTYRFKNIKGVPAWVIPAAILIVIQINRVRCALSPDCP